jgi:hypothetical protein
MADYTVGLPSLKDVTGMYAFVYTKAGVLVNSGGDALTLVSGSGGTFGFTVAETLSQDYYLVNVHSSSTATAGNLLWWGSIVKGDLVCVDLYPPYAQDTLVKQMSIPLIGTLTGAGSSTNVFVGTYGTLTATVDADGNRSAVVFS